MSELLPIEALPNQTFSAVLDNERYELTIKSSKNTSFVTIIRESVTLVSNLRICGGTPILPYKYQTVGRGNFFLTTPAEQVPYYENFGVTQFLVYLTAAEIEALQNDTA